MPAAPALSRRPALVRAIGTLGLAAGIVNITVGGGIFRLPADVALALGPAAPLAYLVCAVAFAFILICFAEAGSRVDMTGGPYAYVETAFGPFAGFAAGMMLWLICTLVLAAVAVIFAVNVGQLVPALGGARGTAALLVVTFAVLSAINVAGVRQGAAFNTVATVVKLVPLLVLVAVGVFHVQAAHLALASPPSAVAVARTSILLVFAFGGTEAALVPSGEVKDVARTVPRAIALAMGTVTCLYVAVQVVAQGVLGPDLATSPAPLAEAASRILGPGGRTLLLVGAAVSMLGNVSGMILSAPRALFAFAVGGFVPSMLGAVHPRFHTPYVAIAAQSALACVLAITGTFERLAILANVTTLVLYAACCLAAWRLRRRDVRAGGVPFRIPGAAVAPWAALLVIAWMLTGIRRDEWMGLAVALGASVLLFAATARSRAARAAPPPPSTGP